MSSSASTQECGNFVLPQSMPSLTDCSHKKCIRSILPDFLLPDLFYPQRCFAATHLKVSVRPKYTFLFQAIISAQSVYCLSHVCKVESTYATMITINYTKIKCLTEHQLQFQLNMRTTTNRTATVCPNQINSLVQCECWIHTDKMGHLNSGLISNN